MQPRRKRLLEAHEEIPRHELAAVRMPGKLEIVACGLRGQGRARLVGEQHADCIRGAGDRVSGMAGMRRVEAAGIEIGDAGHDHLRAVVLKNDVFIDENP